jgi:hydrogenase-4 component E
VSPWLAWALVGLGLGVVVVRRRSSAIILVTMQSLALATGALWLARDRTGVFVLAAVILLAKAMVVGIALAWSLRRTRETGPVRDGLPAPMRLVVALAVALATAGLVPSFGLDDRVGDATVVLVFIGAAIVLLRRATIHQAIGLLVAENGVSIAAVSAHDGLPLVIEVGFVFDVLVLIAVLLVVHEKIFGEFGVGDTRLLRHLRDER